MGMKKEIVIAQDAPKAIGPYSAAVKAESATLALAPGGSVI